MLGNAKTLKILALYIRPRWNFIDFFLHFFNEILGFSWENYVISKIWVNFGFSAPKKVTDRSLQAGFGWLYRKNLTKKSVGRTPFVHFTKPRLMADDDRPKKISKRSSDRKIVFWQKLFFEKKVIWTKVNFTLRWLTERFFVCPTIFDAIRHHARENLIWNSEYSFVVEKIFSSPKIPANYRFNMAPGGDEDIWIIKLFADWV
jgi:hypothetical protein